MEYWKLNKALYGLRQSERIWNDKLNNTLLKLNFKRLISYSCVYTKSNNEGKIIYTYNFILGVCIC